MGNEGCLPLVAVLDLHVVVSPANIKLGENFGISQLIHKVGDEGERVGVMNGVFIDIMVVLAGAESSILFFDEKERGGLGRVGRTNFSRCEILV